MIRFYLRSGQAAMMLLLGAAAATAQPTQFTYQGQLKQSGAPYSGPVAFDCVLWDADSVGNPVGASLSLPGVNVIDGLFTVQLDFGAGVFDGGRRWLEISVNGATLTPRQEVTAAPYAMFAARPWVTSGADLSYVAGNVGIGTASPAQMLSVAGTVQSTSGGFMFPDGSVQSAAATGGGGYWSPNGSSIFGNNSGNVGIGTTAPTAKLDIAAIGEGAQVLRLTTERPWSFRQAYWGPGTALRLQPDTGLKSFEIAGPSGVNVATFHADESNPRVGIGTTNPLSRLDIAASGAGAELLRFTTERPWIFRQIYSGPSTGLQLYSTSGLKNFEITAANGVNVATFVTDTVNPRVGIGTTTPTATLDVNGTTRTRVLVITGADLAEKFPTSGEKVEPGTVMEIDPDYAGKLRVAIGAYNSRVAGVVSGANDFPAGAILGHLPGQEDAPAVALSGRVWVRCNAGAEAIRPGDLLTTSDAPGHAMKAVDRDRSHGAIIGKAMGDLAQGERGLVLVLVNLQ